MLTKKEIEDILFHYSWYHACPADPIILFTHAEMSRNCSHLPFPSSMDTSASQNFKRRVTASLSKDRYFSQWKRFFCRQNDLSLLQLLSELFILPSSFFFDVPQKQLYFSPLDRSLIALLHRNHFSFYTIETGKNLEAAYFQLLAVERYLEKFFSYAYHKKSGYITAHYNSMGTALKLRVVMHLPFMMQSLDYNVIAAKFRGAGIKIRPFHWNNIRYPGLYIIENAYTYGMKEEEIITTVQEAVSSLESSEIRARNKAFENNPLGNYNLILRSLALLQTSCLLSHKEMIEYLLHVRIGLERGVFPSMGVNSINECLCCGQPFHIKHLSELNNDSLEEQNLLRSKLIIKKFSEIMKESNAREDE